MQLIGLADALREGLSKFQGKALGIAVSGGGDSLALLYLAQDCAAAGCTRLEAATVDHGLRAESADEAQMVALHCKALGIAHQTLVWDGRAAEGNLQANARQARYKLLSGWAQGQGLDAVLLAHTEDDVAETFLMRLARRAGAEGLAAMAEHFEREGVDWLRPLLGVRRADLRAYLRARDIQWAEDPSNSDRAFDRVKAREALAALEPLGLGVAEIAASARNLAAENVALQRVTGEQAAKIANACFGGLSLNIEGFRALSPEIARRMVASAVLWITGAPYAPRAEACHRFLTTMQAGETQTLAGVMTFTAKGNLWLVREPSQAGETEGNIFDGRWRVSGAKPGEELRALGQDGLKQLDDWRALGVPRPLLLTLPSLWDGASLKACPPLGLGDAKAALLRPSFDKWSTGH